METRFKPSIQNVWDWWRWCEGMLERDPKGQLADHFRTFLKTRGYTVKEG